MDSAIISKIEKARRYSAEPSRVVFSQFTATVQGDHRAHTVTYAKGEWHCDCDYFAHRHYCSHTMTLERLLGVMIPPEWSEELQPS
ncbi:MAG: hypothetical protein U0641_04335 [Anaerolineae bacterium]